MDDIKIIITDDHSLFRSGVRKFLENKSGIDIIGEAENGKDLLDKLEILKPELVIMGVSMPVMDGVETMPILRKKFPYLKVIILSFHNDPSLICRMLELGANTYLTKESRVEKIYEAILACQQKWFYINDVVVNAITAMKTENIGYSKKELEILSLLNNNVSLTDIATKVDLSSRTVENIIIRLQEKTNTKTIAELSKKTKHFTKTSYMNKFLSFIKNIPVKKVVLFFCFLLLVVALVVFGPIMYKSYQEKKKMAAQEKQQAELKNQRIDLEKKVAVVKPWRVESQEGIGAKEITFVTKWQNGSMYYKFDVELLGGANEIRRNRNSRNGFIIYFVDKDGFKVFTFRIPLTNMTGIVDENNSLTGLSVNDKIDITAQEYIKLDEWQIGWDF